MKKRALIGLLLAVGTAASVSAQSPAAEHKVRHGGVLVAGHGSPVDTFAGIVVDIFDLLGERGVEVANRGLEKIDEQKVVGFTPLPQLLEMVPAIGASGLLYIRVTPGFTYRAATVSFQCFDPAGHIVWQDKANDVLVDGGNTVFHRTGWKKKLGTHIGGPCLTVKPS